MRNGCRIMCGVSLLVAALGATACAPLRPCIADCNSQLPAAFQADATPPVVVTLAPTSAWVDTGMEVHKGDRLIVTSIGEVFWQAQNRATGPDGASGSPGVRVGPGGLAARVGSGGKPFDVGARTQMFHDQHPRPPHHTFAPPPLTMPGDGPLFLGFKRFTPGSNTGSFEVSIQRAVPIDRGTAR